MVAAIDAKMYLDNFSLWRTILIGKEVDYYSTGRNPLGVRVPRPPFNNYRRVTKLAKGLDLESSICGFDSHLGDYTKHSLTV